MIFSRWRTALGMAVLLAGWVLSGAAVAQPGNERAAFEPVWSPVEDLPAGRSALAVGIRARRFKGFQLNQNRLRKMLAEAPQEAGVAPRTSAAILELPLPDGSLKRFRYSEAPVMAPELAAKFPELRTYVGECVEEPGTSVRFDLTPAGFHAQILSPEGAVYIDPAFRDGDALHTSYYKRDLTRPQDGFRCLWDESPAIAGRNAGGAWTSPLATLGLARSGANLRTYRLAVAATGEYTAYHGGTVSGGLAAIVTAVNRVTGVYESELAIRFVLVADNNLVVFTNASSDPFSNGNPSSLLSQNQSTLDSIIGDANYDLGHIFSTAGGGLAALGVVCQSGMKAQGETGTSTPLGDAFYIDYVAHEIGHQFGANHTFNSANSNCGGGNRSGSTAYERGSGSTIMAYAGICGSDDLQPHSDPYFHSASFDEILNYSTASSGNSCAVLTSTGNQVPVVDAGPNYTIPQNTPFTLTANGSDPDGDPLTYCWEERDLGGATTVGAADNGSSPLFRSWPPESSPSRTFPRLDQLRNNTLPVGEVMPTTTRTLNFRVTARDHRAGGGGVNTADMQVSVSAAAGPFQLTSHDSGGTFSGVQTVSWDVAGTAAPPVNTASVNLLLSTNGGVSFPITLLAGTPNDGAQPVVLPNLNTTQARLKVEAVGNIYFDIGNANFTIIPDVPTPLVMLSNAVLIAESCVAANNAIDPDESVTLDFTLQNVGTGDLTNLVATLLLTNGVSVASEAQSFGELLAGGAAVTRPFSLTATGACGGEFTASLQLQQGELDFGTVSRTFNLGAFTANTFAYTNATEITVPVSGSSGPGSPFPSTVAVAGLDGSVSKVTVTIRDFTHNWPADVDLLLVGPTGESVILLSDAGGGIAINGVDLTFDDAATSTVSDAAQLTSGTFKPTNYGAADTFAPPAPSDPYGGSLAVFKGSNPNGEWALFVQDDASQDVGSFAQGWQLSITTSNASCCGSNPVVSDLALLQSVSLPLLNVSSNVVVALVVTNSGPDGANAVVVTNRLPVGLGLVSAVASQGTFTNLGDELVFDVGVLAVGTSAAISIEVVALAAGSWTNEANVAGGEFDPEYGNNQSAATVTANAFPVISALSDITTNEDSEIAAVALTVGDSETGVEDLALDALSADTNLVPLANLILSGTGADRSLSITPAANQNGSTLITLSLSDGMATVQSSFTVTFEPVNDPPAILPIPDFTLLEGEFLIHTNVAFDLETTSPGLEFSLVDAPAGMSLDPDMGILTWTPGETDGGTTNLISIVVKDAGAPSLSATQTFMAIVLESNSPPILPAIADAIIPEGSLLSFTNLASDPDLPVNALIFSLASAPDGAAVDAGQGSFAWMPDETQGGSTNIISVILTDDGIPSQSVTQSFTVVVLETNSAPILDSIPEVWLTEGDTLTITNLAYDSDQPNNTLSFSLENAPAGVVINPTNGVLTWNTSESDGPTTNLFSVIVTDDGLPSLNATQSLTIVVLETNSAPLLAAIPDVLLLEGEVLAVTNSAFDSDQPNNILSFSLENAPVGVVINPTNGVLTWNTTESDGPTTNLLSLIVTDDGLPILSATQSLTIVVLETNSAPLLESTPDVWLTEGDTLTITNLAYDSDLPNNALSFRLENGPVGVILNPTNGVLTWNTAESDGPTTNLLSVIVTDDGLPILSATQSLRIVVLETNSAPFLESIPDVWLTEGDTLTITNLALDSDSPPNALSFGLLETVPGATLDAASGVFTWTPNESQGGTTNLISFVVTDDGVPSLGATQSFTIVVLETNAAPVLSPPVDYTVFEGESLAITNYAMDSDLPANSLNFNLLAAPVGVDLNPTNGVLTWTPDEVQGPGDYLISVRVQDDGVPSLSATQSFRVFVLETNLAPALAAVTNFTIFEGAALTFTNAALDADLPVNVLTFSLADAPPEAAMGADTGVFSWTPNEWEGGTTNFLSVIVTDNGSPPLTASQSFTVIVLESNRPPALQTISDSTIPEGATLSFWPIATDADYPENKLSFALANAPTNAAIDPESGWFSWTPDETQGPGTNLISLVVTDDGEPSLSITQSFTVVVSEVNNRPVLDPIADLTIPEGELLIITNLASDIDLPGNHLAFSLVEAPAGALIDSVSGLVAWTPDETNGPGVFPFSVVVSDDGSPSLSATQSFSVVVLELNAAPQLTAISDHKIHAGTTLVLTNTATDPDWPANALAFTLDPPAPPGASIGEADGLFSWSPGDVDADTVRSFTVRVTDDAVPPASQERTFLVTVVSRPRITSLEVTNGVAGVTWSSLSGQTYRLQFQTNLGDSLWQDAYPDVVATSSASTQTNLIDAAALRFYRVMLVP